MLISGDKYVERLSGYEREIYVRGEKVEDFTNHPNIKPVVKSIALTYELAGKKDEYSPYSKLVDDKVNRLNYVNENAEDLIARYDFQRELSMRLGTCNYRCTGCDAINSLYPATKEMDERLGTDYHKRFLELLKEIQRKDYACTAALTDTKGDRSKRPKEAKDMYVHVVEKREDGIVVSGAKIHQSGAFAADINFVLPTQTFKEGEEEFAIAFAVKPEDEGVKYILQNTGYQAKFREGGEFEIGNPYGDRITCTVIFDNVFIPWERVFVFEDLKATRNLLTNFAISHRCVGASCKAGFIDSMTGAASLMLKVNGLDRVPVLRQKIGEMVGVSEAAHAIAVGSATKGFESYGTWLPNMLMANSGKVIGVEGFNKVIMNLAEIAGGIPVTAPSEFDLKSEEVGKYVEKYLVANPEFSAEERMKVIKFVEFWITSSHLLGAVHGGGSPAAAVVFLQILADMKEREEAVRDIIGLKR
ncbi:Aromatic ring hydroxylase [Archaeoglobus sulfaticallidus PM70-1]|uniref:Aromatic ring hydroxylase n=1 Tax=Archaeoglobus sulfaticallidus PM70-1 TaxID=387631 RepID=N0BDJ3_9EURY|nr:4-hydroxyphenylacetate 3-hydroxylase N-terminal domain-containing protein [Archaeoglobus sulfaticallidus]AGK61704.1 Aromatic ring hydroxylase [Archaeoglobus sulfaticallidus PM70-1]